MRFIVFWSPDNDYSGWYTERDCCPSMGPEILNSLQDVSDFIVHILRRHPSAMTRVFEVGNELSVEAEIPDAVVTIKGVEK